ncbi:MAG: hypothetical protein V3T53_01945 [Phycisphaerales bacterium]
MTGYPWTAWLWWIGGAALGLLGVWLLYWSLLHDRSKGRRRCPKCWYNMSGTDSLTCSECGRTVKREEKLHKTRRRKRLAGLALLTFLSGAALSTWPTARDFDVNTIKPVWLLKNQGKANSAQGMAARRELVRRLQADRLSSRQIQSLVEHALAIQADPNAYWSGPQFALNRSWGAVVETAWEKDWLSREQIGRYTQTAFGQSFSVELRATIRSGAPLPVRFKTGAPRLSDRWRIFKPGGEMLIALAEVESITVGDIQIPYRRNPTVIGQSGMGGWKTEPALECDLPPGKHTVRFVWDFAVRKQIRGQMRVATPTLEPDPATDLAHWKEVLEFEIEVLPADEFVVRLVADQTIHDEIRDAIQIELVATQLAIGQGQFYGQKGMILIDTVPMDLSFDVFCRAGGIEKKIGAIFVRGQVNDIQRARRITDDPNTLFPNAPMVDVIFRTSTAPAERTIDSTAVWNGEIIVENVPLRRAEQDDQADHTSDDRH